LELYGINYNPYSGSVNVEGYSQKGGLGTNQLLAEQSQLFFGDLGGARGCLSRRSGSFCLFLNLGPLPAT
jgi:hypothetical protein